MRDDAPGGGKRGSRRPRPADHAVGVPVERCANCHQDFEVATMFAYRDGMWCLRCTLDSVESEQRALGRDAAAARRREFYAVHGQRFVRGR
jgi:recombinational DNA repair protein (RecF pathway)